MVSLSVNAVYFKAVDLKFKQQYYDVQNNSKNDPKKLVGMRIRELRLAKGVSQEALADLAGIHRTYMGSVERGERNISLENIVKIAKALKVQTRELLKTIP